MRTVSLARVAAQAELLLVRRLAAVLARRAVFGAVAALFGIAVLVMLHVAALVALGEYAHLMALASIGIVLAVDLAVAIIFGLLAGGKLDDPLIEEARRVRDQSIEQARQSLTLAAMLAPLARVVTETGLLRILLRMVGRGFSSGRGSRS